MDNFVDERDYRLLENDKYTFSMLGRIMGGRCELLLTDHEKLIISRSSEDAAALSIKTSMFAYDCPNLKEPHIWADGELHRCVPEDIDELVEFIDFFSKERRIYAYALYGCGLCCIERLL